jgi:isopenicillin N synthase-like dioxygenase
MAETITPLDLTPFRQGTDADRIEVARRFDAACRETGFLVISGHGVSEPSQQALYDAGQSFFDLEADEKLKIRRTHHEQNRGFIPYGEERLVRMHGGDSPPDYKEVFAIGPCNTPEEPYYTGDAGYPNFAANIWPDRPTALKSAMETYFAEISKLTETLMQVAATALGLETDWFEDKIDRHTSHLRLLHYPPPAHQPEEGQLRCGPHTDLGAVTILRNEAVPGGLEVRSLDGEWIAAPAIPNTFIVNIGDLMARWTNDRWVSTPHRVALPPVDAINRSRRLSIAYFLRPNYDAEIACIPGCAGPEQPARYAPTTLQAYSVGRFSAGAGPAAG